MRPSVAFVALIYVLNAGLPVLALPTRGGSPLSDIAARNLIDAPFDIEARELGHDLEKRQFAGLFQGIIKIGSLIGKAIKGAKGLRGIRHIKQIKSSNGFKQVKNVHKNIDRVQQQQQQQQQRQQQRQQQQQQQPQQQQRGRKHHRRGLLHGQIIRRDHRLDLNARRLEERHIHADLNELD